MQLDKEPTHAFIVRIWVEHQELQSAEPIWRGVIQHVENDKRVYFKDLDELRRHFADFLRDMGIKPDAEDSKV